MCLNVPKLLENLLEDFPSTKPPFRRLPFILSTVEKKNGDLPAQGPMIREICGITPEDITFRCTNKRQLKVNNVGIRPLITRTPL